MDDEQTRFYRGRFDHVPDRQLNSVRIFVSSTFSDTTDERNGLIEHVYPRLREYCLSKYNLQFQYSDMRWGIQSSASNTHSTVDMCLQELDTCCRLSLATNCVVLLSHRYGSRLVPACLSEHLFQQLSKSLSSAENDGDRLFLHQMYQLDENYLDGKYFLRSVDDQEQWAPLEKKLQLILRQAADIGVQQGTMTADERKEFYISVTAQEILRALQKNGKKSRRMICFFRELSDIEELDAKYRETENIDEIQPLLAEVKNDLHQSMDPADIHTYQLRWKDEKKRSAYLSKFFDDFYRAVQTQIDHHLSSNSSQSNNPLFNQILEHAIQCKALVQRYFPRDDILEQVKGYITSADSGSTCILLGESGTGKSSIMAKLVSEIPQWYPSTASVSVIIRFLGATPSSSDIRSPLISIIEQICAIYHWPLPSSLDNVKDTLESLLREVPAQEHLILLLDSIDQLQLTDLRDLSVWLPCKYSSSNVKCLLSTIPEIEFEREQIRIHEQLQLIYQQQTRVEIPIDPFDEHLAERVLASWLEQDRRSLTSTQYQWLKPKMTSSPWLTPLFLSLLYDQTLTWHSFDVEIDRRFLAIKRTSDAIGYLYHRLGEKHGQVLFRRSMKYLQLSGGLNELELEDILSSDDDVLQSVFLHYLPPWKLFRLPSTLWIRIRNDMQKYLVEKQIDHLPCLVFYHRSFQYYQPMDVRQLIIDNQEKESMEKVRLEYFAEQNKTTFDMTYSPKLAKKYQLATLIIPVDRCLLKQKPFRGKKNRLATQRRLHQLLININRYDFVHPWTIFNYDFLSAYLRCGEYRLSDLLYQFSIGAHDPNGELRFLLKQLERCISIVNHYPSNLAFELIYHLAPHLDDLPVLTSTLLEQCVSHCPLQLLTGTERDHCLAKHSLSSIVSLTLDEHRLFVLTENNQLIVYSYAYYGLLKTGEWEISYQTSATLERSIAFLCQYPYVCCLSSHGSIAVIDCQKNLLSTPMVGSRLISLINAELLLIISSSKQSIELWHCDNHRLLSSFEFPDETIDFCTYQKPIIQVQLKSSERRYYLSIDADFQFKAVRILHEKLPDYPHHFLLDCRSEFHYSFHRSDATLVLFDDQPTKSIIDFSSSPTTVIHLAQSQSIAWLTSTSLTVFHPLYEQKIFQPFHLLSSDQPIHYDAVHDHYSSLEFEGQSQFLACVNKAEYIIDIYEWRYDKDQQKFLHRRLTHLQLDIGIDQCVFTVGWFDGITIYWSDGSTVSKYNATLLTYLPSHRSISSLAIEARQCDVHCNEFLVCRTDHSTVKIFRLNDQNQFQFALSREAIIDYVITGSASDILLIDQKNTLAIYSLTSSTLRWTNNDFSHQKLHVHSLPSSFLLVCLSSQEIFQIDAQSLKLTRLIQLPLPCALSVLTGNHRLYSLATDQSTLAEFHLATKKLTVLPTLDFHSASIREMHSVGDHLIFHADDDQIYLWWKVDGPLSLLEKASRCFCKEYRFVLQCSETPTLVLYDLKKKLRGMIELDKEMGQCGNISLSEQTTEHEQYLFLLGEDRLLRMYRVEDGRQLAKLHIHSQLKSMVGIINDRLLLWVGDRLCLIKIHQKRSRSKEISPSKCPLFEQSMWMTCHHEQCPWP